MSPKPQAFVSTVRVSAAGPHEYVSVWIRGQNVGTLCVGKGDGEPLAWRLRGCRCPEGFVERHAVHMLGCPLVDAGDRVRAMRRPDDDDDRVFTAPPQLDLDAVNRWRTSRGLPPLRQEP